MVKHKPSSHLCPCQWHTNTTYQQCCGLYIEQQQLPKTAEALMRSRYSAYVYENQDYLNKTWHPSTRPESLELEPTQWLELTVHSCKQLNESTAQVTFSARYKINGKAFKLKECSRFVKENEQWFYVDGDY